MKKVLKNILVAVLTSAVVALCVFAAVDMGNRGKGAKCAAGTAGRRCGFSSLTYAALGDSITRGGIGGGLAEEPYCEVVGNILNLKSVFNYGVSGSTLCSKTATYAHGYRAMCERYSEMREADIVSVMGGTNDFTQGIIGAIDDERTDTVYGAMNALARGLKEKYPNGFIFFMTPLKSVWGTELKQAQICQAIKDVGAKYDIPVLDTYALCDFSKIFKEEGYAGDGVHPSQEFYRDVLAPVIADFIKENYGKATKDEV